MKTLILICLLAGTALADDAALQKRHDLMLQSNLYWQEKTQLFTRCKSFCEGADDFAMSPSEDYKVANCGCPNGTKVKLNVD